MPYPAIFAAALLFAAGPVTPRPAGVPARVLIVEKVPDAAWTWNGSGNGMVKCVGAQCDHYYMPPADAAPTMDITLRLLLPDGRILIAQCMAKPLPGQSHSVFTRSKPKVFHPCEVPDTHSAVDATLTAEDIQLSLRRTEPDGSVATETYHLLGQLAPVAASDAPLRADSTSRIVFIASVPDGARIFVDGRRAGTAPAQLDLSTLEAHQLTLEKEGFRPMQKVVPADNEQTRFTVRLQPAP